MFLLDCCSDMMLCRMECYLIVLENVLDPNNITVLSHITFSY